MSAAIDSNGTYVDTIAMAWSSEGKTLTNDDEKTYWGKISYIEEYRNESEERNAPTVDKDSVLPLEENKSDNISNRRLHVEGSVILGYGLEPLPVARFIMTETTEIQDYLDDDVEDDEEEVDEPTDEFLDWSNAFQ